MAAPRPSAKTSRRTSPFTSEKTSSPELASVKAPRALAHVADAIATRELASVNQLVSPSPPTIDRAVDVGAAEDTPRDPAKSSATTSNRHHTSVATGRGFGGAFTRGVGAAGAGPCCH